MADSATILIPDISGYTEFLTKTELVHSSHIINELLDAILAANSDEFELSEVEGDALLLYRKGQADRSRRPRSALPEHVRKLPHADQDHRAGLGVPVRRLQDGIELEPEVRRPSRHGPGNQGEAVHEVLGARHGRRPPPAEEPDRVGRVHSRDEPAASISRASTQSPGRSRVGAIERRVSGHRDNRVSVCSRSPGSDAPSRIRTPRISPVIELGDDSVAVEIDAPMLEVYQLVIDLDQRTRWLSAVERLSRPATTERIGMRHVCIFHGLTVEWVAVKSDIGDDEITYVEEGRIVEKDLPARASFVLKRLGERQHVRAVPREVAVQPRAAARDDQRDPRGLQARPRDDQDALREPVRGYTGRSGRTAMRAASATDR